MGETIIQMENIIKRYYVGKPNELQILNGISLGVRRGEFLSIVGESGSGKSTLMNIIGILDRQTEGTYVLEGQDVGGMSDEVRSRIRNARIGFVFQNFNLLPRASALKNVMMPLLYGKVRPKEQRERAMEALKMVGMEDRAYHRPNELSGGQRQRVAIARAMVNDPAIILADEPTGALDSKTGHMVMDLFHRLHEEQGKTIVLITHSQELAAETQRTLTLLDGAIVAEQRLDRTNYMPGNMKNWCGEDASKNVVAAYVDETVPTDETMPADKAMPGNLVNAAVHTSETECDEDEIAADNRGVAVEAQAAANAAEQELGKTNCQHAEAAAGDAGTGGGAC